MTAGHGIRWRHIERAETDAAPGRVMSLLLEPREWPKWQPELLETAGPPTVEPEAVVRGRATMLGFEVHGHSTTLDVDSDLVAEDVLVGVRMRVRYTVTASDDGATMISHDLTLYPLGGSAGRVLGLLLRPRLKRMQRKALKNLVAQAEAESG